MSRLLLIVSAWFFLTGASWVDLYTDEPLVLNQKIDVIATDGQPYTIPAGTELVLTERYLLVLNAWLYRFERADCGNDYGRAVDLILYPHERANYEFGVEIDEDCALNIFLLTEELNGPAIADPINE